VRIVGGEHRKIELRSELKDATVESRLILRVVRLDLEVVTVAEHVGVPGGGLARLVVLIGKKVVRDLAGHAGGRDDDAFAVPGEELPVHARLGVKAFRVGEGRELD